MIVGLLGAVGSIAVDWKHHGGPFDRRLKNEERGHFLIWYRSSSQCPALATLITVGGLIE